MRTFEDFTYFVSSYLLVYAGRTLAELPAPVMGWVLGAWVRGIDAQRAADLLSRARWPERVAVDSDCIFRPNKKRILADLQARGVITL